jgi:hypothetical protein
LLVRSNADKSPVNKVLQSHKDCAVVLTGNLSWLPKGAQANSDDDYALGIVISAAAQLRRVDVFDTTAPYVKFEARGDPWGIDNSLYVRVQLQEKPAKKVDCVWSGWQPRPADSRVAQIKPGNGSRLCDMGAEAKRRICFSFAVHRYRQTRPSAR